MDAESISLLCPWVTGLVHETWRAARGRKTHGRCRAYTSSELAPNFPADGLIVSRSYAIVPTVTNADVPLMDGLPPSARLVGIGFYVAISIVAGTLGGREIDRALDSGTAFTLAGLALGLFLALWGGTRQLMEVLAEINRRRTGGKKE
jgi:hypothetical protein